MGSLRGIVGRLRGDRVGEIARDLAELRELVLGFNHVATLDAHALQALQSLPEQLSTMNHTIAAMNHSVVELAELLNGQRDVLLTLNHDVRSGADEALPLFLGYAERLRLDTDTAIGAAQVIERQLALLEDLVVEAGTAEST